MALELVAPAKINLTLEVLRRRDDGYHEIASVMQTIDLCDRVRVEAAEALTLVVTGPEAAGAPADETNLAYRAAEALAGEAGGGRGARMRLEKRIPASAGLGGGSSDAAAVLRGLDRLWELGLGDERLATIGGRLGSDVPFFVYGGTAVATGRGELIEALPDVGSQALTLFVPGARGQADGSKTGSMYELLRPGDFSGGKRTVAAAGKVRRGDALSIGDLANAFERAVTVAFPVVAEAIAVCRRAGVEVVVCGSGPSFFSLTSREALANGLVEELRERFDVAALARQTMTREESRAVVEV